MQWKNLYNKKQYLVNVNPGLALTGFQTTRPRLFGTHTRRIVGDY